MPASSFHLHLHIPYRGWTNNLLKNPCYRMGLSAPNVEAKSLHNRNKLSLNRKGMTAFAAFLLSFLQEYAARRFLVLDAVPHLSIWILIIFKIQIGGNSNGI